jgi:hypothetical protein
MRAFRRKTKKTPRGFTYDFCSVCRDIKEVELFKIETTTKLYFATLTESGTLFSICRECRSTWINDSPVFETTLPLEKLVSKADIYKKYEKRLEVETRVKDDPMNLSSESRKELLLEPFLVMDSMSEWIQKNPAKFDITSGLGCLFTILFIALIIFIPTYIPSFKRVFSDIAIYAIAGSIVTSLIIIYNGASRRIKKEIKPKIIQAIKPLRPTKDELREVKNELKAQDCKIVKKIDPIAIYDQCL